MKRQAPGKWVDRPIIELHGVRNPALIANIYDALEKGQPFALTDGVSGVILSIGNLTSYEFNNLNQIKSQDTYQDKDAFMDVVKIYIAFYQTFIAPQGLLSFPEIRLIEK